MKALKQAIAIIVISTAAVLPGCGNKPLLTEMTTHKLIVIMKGTYESNSPAPWSIPTERVPDPDDISKLVYTVGHRALVQDDSVNKCDAINDDNPSVFLMDIAEVRLADSQGKLHKFSNFRQNFSFTMDDANPFFNGTGYIMDNDDVPSKLYPAVMIYMRKMLMDGAQKYVPQSEGWSASPMWDVFAEKQYPCLNFNKMQVHSFYDTLRYESSYFNRVFPVVVPIQDAALGMIYNDAFPVTVLEIRFVIKNFVKKYEYQSYINDVFTTIHYFAMSDWLQDVKKDEIDIGGNLLMVARSYIPGLTGKISGINPYGTGAHIIAIPAGADINDYTIPGERDAINPPGTLLTDAYKPGTITITPPKSPRFYNDCDLSKKPSAYLGSNINQALDYYLKTEQYNYNWNERVPSSCGSFDDYKDGWDTFKRDVGNFRLPQLAVWAAAGTAFSFENVPPGNYDIYVANVEPRYGYLYYDGQFGAVPQWSNVSVSAGGNTGL